MSYVEHDGGRAEAGFKGNTRDCVVRAIAIAAGLPYREVYDKIAALNKAAGYTRSGRNGTRSPVYEPYLIELGFVRRMSPKFQGRKARTYDMPPGRIIARQAKHIVAVIDGVAYDTFDTTERMVYKYWLLNK